MRTALFAAALLLGACNPATEETTTTTTETETTAPTLPAPAPTVVVLTEEDARSRIEAAGYTNVTGLMQAPDGTWTASATRDGQTTQVTVGESGVSVVTTPAPTP